MSFGTVQIFILLAAVSAAAAFVTTPLMGRVAGRRGWVDNPDVRKHHFQPTPLLGGVSIAVGVLVGLLVLAAASLWYPLELPPRLLAAGLGLGTLFFLGLYDDIAGIGYKRKFVIQLVVAYLMLHAGFRLDVSHLPFFGTLDPYSQALVSVPLTLLWIVGLINAINLIDGLDGLAAGVALIAFATMGLIFGMQGNLGLAAVAVVATAATGAFLYFNFHPASIFMGDCGSMMLGFMVALLSLEGLHGGVGFAALFVPFVALGLPILDTTLTMSRRMMVGKSPFMPDADHIHHRMLRRTGSVRTTTLWLYAVCLAFGGLAVALALFGTAGLAVTLVGVPALTYVLLRQLGYFRIRTLRRQIQWLGHVRARQRELAEGGPLLGNGDGTADEGAVAWSLSSSEPHN